MLGLRRLVVFRLFDHRHSQGNCDTHRDGFCRLDNREH
jgi:hypothetical protein